MLKFNATRYSNILTGFLHTRSITKSNIYTNSIRFKYKQLFINSLYFNRQLVKRYNISVGITKNYKFMLQNAIHIGCSNVRKTHFNFMNINSVYKTQFSKTKNLEFGGFLLNYFTKLGIDNLCYYWMSAMLRPTIQTRFYCFTNKIKFFLNQRLVKQPVLLLYSSASNRNTYANYLKIFKGLLQKKNNNSLLFFKSILFQIYPKYGTQSYFFRHTVFIRKFVNNRYLKIVLT